MPLCGGMALPARPSVRPRKPRPWRDIAILACPPPPAPSIPVKTELKWVIPDLVSFMLTLTIDDCGVWTV